MRYGMPYKGSKNKIAEWIVDQLPSAKHFYDLFRGGGAISHCAYLSNKYKTVHYNELNPLIFKAFGMAVNGEFRNEKRWISHEEFLKLRFDDPYVNLCFSFGNNGKGYCYSPKNEQFKKAVHYSIMFNDHSLLSKIVDIKNLKYTSNDLHERRLQLQHYFKNYIKNVESFCNTENGNARNILQSLERLERLQSLDDLNGLCNLRITNLDYKDVQIEADSVIYCDIPYKGTSGYGLGTFNYGEFYDYCRTKNNIFISEYAMPLDFKVVAEKYKFCALGTTLNRKITTEKLFTIN